MEDFADKKCVPCEGGVKPFSAETAERYLAHVPGWALGPETLSLVRDYTFPDFKHALGFVNRVGEIAEAEGHHPDISFGWGHARVTLSTHAIGGLSENDFILAAKINKII